MTSSTVAAYHVHDYAHVLEKGVDVASRSAKSRFGLSPKRRVGRLAGDIGGNRTSSEVPDLDQLIGPLEGVDATSDSVEVISV